MTLPIAFPFFSSRRGRRWVRQAHQAWAFLPADLRPGTLALAWAVVLFMLSVIPALAYQPTSDAQPHETVCHDRDELASVIQAEAFSQPMAAQIAIAQIVKREADSRGLSVCALTRLTWFVSVRRYAALHPDSWTAWQMAHPLEWSMDIADDVLLGNVADMTRGAGHFDGADHEGQVTLWQAGQVRFFR